MRSGTSSPIRNASRPSGAKIPKGRAAVRSAGHRQDAPGPSRGRRGGRAVLLHLGLGLRRDVRRGRCQPGPGPVRAGQAGGPGHHLRRRDRRGRSAPGHRAGRGPRRAGADAQPAPGRDGRLRSPPPGSSSSPPPTGPTSSIRPCCARAGSTARSSSTSPTWAGAEPSWTCTPTASPSVADVDLDILARRTPGFTGADLANILNEAALLAARRRDDHHLHARVRGGDRPRPRRARTRPAGSCPTGRSASSPTTRRVTPSSATCCPTPIRSTRCRSSPGAGRWAGPSPSPPRTGCCAPEPSCSTRWPCCSAVVPPRSSSSVTPRPAPADDIERATQIARAMVTEYGMSEALGPQQLGRRGHEPFLGRDMGGEPEYCDEVARPSTPRSPVCSTRRTARPARSSRCTGRRSTGWPMRSSSTRPSPILGFSSCSRTASWPPARGMSDPPRMLNTRRPAPRPAFVLESRHDRTHQRRPRRRRSARGPRRRGTGPLRRPHPHRSHAGPRRPAAASQAAVREILIAIGEDPDRDGLLDTPDRVARMYAEVFSGLREVPDSHLQVTFEADHDEMVMVRDIAAHVDVRAPPRPVHGQGPRRLHPQRRRPGHRPVQAGPPGRRLRQAPAGPGAAHRPDRRRDRAHPAAPRRAGRHRGRAPVHVDARRPQARLLHGHVGGARPVPRQRGHAVEAMRFIERS